MIKAISFDIGGTLIKPSENESLIQQLSTLSTKSTEVVKRAYKEHFLTKCISLAEFCEKTNIKQAVLLNRINHYYKFKAQATVWEDVPVVLEQLKRLNLVLIAISNSSYMNPFHLNSYGLQSWFAQEIYSYEVGYAKPHVSIFQYAQQLLQMRPYEILHVGNSYMSDYLGAKRAHWNSILLHRQYGCTLIQKNIFVINSLYNLSDYLQEFFRG